MHWQYIPYMLPLLIAAALSAALALFAWRRRSVAGATQFTLLMLAVAEWSLVYALELGSADLPIKLFWAKVQYLGIVTVPVAWLAFALQYTSREKWLMCRNLALLAIVPLVTLLLVWTNDFHELIWRDIGLDTNGPFAVMDFTRGPWHWVNIAYSYLLLLLGTLLLIQAFICSPHLYREQAGALLIGALAPWMGNVLWVSGLSPFPYLDLTPFAFTLSGLVVVWSLFRYQLLDIVPVARDAVIESMSDGVIVLDAQDRIVDLNPATERIIGRAASEAIGQPAAQALSGRPDLVERYCNVTEAHAEIVLGKGEAQRTYDLRISPLHDRRGRLTGRLVVLHDITERKRAEDTLKRRLEQLASLNRVSQAVTASLARDQVLTEIVSLAGQVAASDYASVVLVDEEGRLGRSVEYLPDVLDIEHRGSEGFTHRIVRSRQVIVVDDIDEDGTISPRPVNGAPCTATPLLVKAGVKSFVGLPLVAKGRLLGVLYLHSLRPGNFRNQLPLLTTFANQAALAIENARVYEEERKRATQLGLTGRITQRIASILDLDELLPQVVRMIRDTFGYYNTSILLVEAGSDELIMRAGVGPFMEALVDRLRLEIGREGITGWVAHSGEPLLVNDVSREARYYITEESKDARSELAVPIKLKGEIIGVLDVQSVELDAFGEDDIFILQTLADQLAVAIENARLYQETARRLEETETLGAVATTLTHSLDLDQVLQSIVDSATRLIPASASGVIHLADEAAGKLIPRATSASGVNVQKSMGMPIGKGIAGLVMQEKRLINVPNVEKDPRFLPLDTGTLKKSLLTAPLLIDGDCIGTLSLNSDQVGAFSADDERLLTTLAAQATIAVRNARLHQEVRRQLEELIFLNRVGRAVTSSLDLEQTLTTVLEETALVLRTEACSILLLDEESNELVFEAAVGPRSEVKGLRLPLDQGIAGWVAREGQQLLASDVREDPRFYSGIDEATGFVTRSVLAAPLKVKGQVIGAIEAVNKTEGDFDQADGALLFSMARWAAIAVENAQLFAETRRRFEEMAALYDTSLDITARLEMPELLKSIVERAVGLLRADSGGVYLYDQEREVLRLAIGYGHTEKYVGVTLKPGKGMAGKVFQSGEPIIVDDYRTWEGRAALFEADQPFTATLEVPLKWQDRISGVLAINADVQKRTFKQDDVWLATLFANQAAIAIENARLYEELQDRMEELKRTQAQLIQSAKLAAIGELAAGVAHEINNPLTSIVGFTRLLLREVDDGDPMKEDLQIIDREAARTKAIVKGLLDFARQREPRLEPTDINEIVRTTTALVCHQAKSAMVIIKESYDETLPLVSLDTDQIKQVFLNMMTNAIQAMPGGGKLKVVTAYQPRAHSPDLAKGPALSVVEGRRPEPVEGMDGADCVVVEFHDTGTGISEKDLPRIFDPFFTTKEVGQGTGLGLSISQGIVERHGGKIEVESKVGWGSTFTVLLPVRDREQKE